MQHPGLTPLHISQGSITSTDGQLHIVRLLGDGVKASEGLPASVAANWQRADAPAWTREASKGLFLDLKASDAGCGITVDLGEVCATAFLACARIKLCWMGPAHSSTVAGLPKHIQFLLAQLSAEGCYAVILPLLPNNCKATLQPASQQLATGNHLAVHLDTGSPDIQRCTWQAAVYVAAGADPFQLCDVAVAAAAAVAGGAKPRWEKQLPDIACSFGWCTWDAFYHGVSARGIAAGLQSFKQAGVQPCWMIIDDGWQRTGLDHVASHLQQQQQRATAGLQGSRSLSPSRSGGDGTKNGSTLEPTASLLQPIKGALHRCTKWLLRAMTAFTHARCLWPWIVTVLRGPCAGALSWLLKSCNAVTSEHSKRLLSVGKFNGKFSDLSVGPGPDTSTTSETARVAAFIAAIKQQYGLKHVLAWHAIIGYWSGVSPTAEALDAAAASPAVPAVLRSGGASDGGAAAAADVVLPRVTAAMSDLEPPCNWSQLVLAGVGLPRKPHLFLGGLHSHLTALGISGVKVDVQNQLELVGTAAGQGGGQLVAQAWHDALEDSVASHFPGNVLINCMSHNTSDLYRMRDSCLARVSDDFYPRLAASHTTHVSACAFTSLFMGPIVQPDWDMFHSKHPRALLHATARMISGGPVYVSDAPGRHDPELLSRLVLPGGQLLQPQLPGRPCRDCLFVDPCCDGVSLLKVWNQNTCGGVLAVFNVQGSSWSRQSFDFVTHDTNPPSLTTTAHPGDIPNRDACFIDAAGSTTSNSGISISGSGSGSNQQSKAAAAEGPAGTVHRSTAGIRLGGGVVSTGSYVMYSDRLQSLTVVQQEGEGLPVKLPAAGSEVLTVAPVLQLRHAGDVAADRGGSYSSSVTGDRLLSFAVVGLVNMLNPGGAMRAIHEARVWGDDDAGIGSGPTRGSSSGSSSGSWVVTPAGGEAGAGGETVQPDSIHGTTQADDAGAAAAGDASPYGGASASAHIPVGSPRAVSAFEVHFIGCGKLLLYCTAAPGKVLLNGRAAMYEYDDDTKRLQVQVKAPAGGSSDSLQHVLVVEADA